MIAALVRLALVADVLAFGVLAHVGSERRRARLADPLGALRRCVQRVNHGPVPGCHRGTGHEQRRAQCRRGVPLT